MSYSDYGGYAFRNGKRVVERSDCAVSPSGLKSSPGIYPGFVFEELRGEDAPLTAHVVLGDGPVFVCLRKQSMVWAYIGSTEVKGLDLRPDFEQPFPQTKAVEIHGCCIEAHFAETDNYYCHVRMTQPDGTVWVGWSGYGVGAGLEDCGYGFDQDAVQDYSDKLWSK